MTIGNEAVKKILDMIDGVGTGRPANIGEMTWLLKEIERRVADIKSNPESYAKQISEFIGSGPKGIYNALMEEREKERELEKKRDQERIKD